MSPILALLLALQAASPDLAAGDPAVDVGGRIVVEVQGDLMLRAVDGSWRRLTRDPAPDRQPAWLSGGEALVFVSERSGQPDLWRLDLDGGGAPRRLTSSPEADTEPAVLPDGRILFVRGRGPLARLWVLAPDGGEARLTTGDLAERSPAPSPDGLAVAYIAERDGEPELRVRQLESGEERRLDTPGPPRRPAWSPDGGRIAFSTVEGRPGVWVTTPDGRYANLISERRAAAAWSPSGRQLILAALPRPEPGYNGDPDRLGDRAARDLFPGATGLWMVDVPPAPDAGLEALALEAPPRPERNAAALERVTERIERLYFAGDAVRRSAWRAVVDRHRQDVLAAPDETALERAIHRLVRDRPLAAEPTRGRAAVSSAHPLATEAGLEILRAGGNVVDAAVAVSFALGVVEPDASGIGGYGQMLIGLAGMERPALIEFMTRAPEEAGLDNARLLDGDGEGPDVGPVLANVPGTVAGMYRAWEEHGSGRVAWRTLLEPAIRLAEEGFPVSDGLATTLHREREHYLRWEGATALFFRDGEPIRAGETLTNPDLARTLRQIADGGADAFYRGPIAERMVADLRGHGNAMRRSDVARYFAASREPVRGTYRGHTLYSSAPPSAGGASLVAKLNLLERTDAADYREDDATLHAMIEAWKLAPSTRGRIADPGLWPVDVDAVTSKAVAAERWRCFDPERASTEEDTDEEGPRACPGSEEISAAPGHGNPECDQHRGGRCHATGTTAFAVADADGNMVSVTQTLGTWGGNFYVTPGLGFIYNDKLRSYALERDRYNARLPFARHGSSISPTLVFEGTDDDAEPLAALGAAGNAWITSAVYQMTAALVDRGAGPQEALERPRFLVTRQTGNDGRDEVVIQIEDDFSPDAIRGLRRRGHLVQPISLRGELRMGYGAMVVLEDDEAIAGGDPRRSGTGGAVQ